MSRLAARCWDDVHPVAYHLRVSVVPALLLAAPWRCSRWRRHRGRSGAGPADRRAQTTPGRRAAGITVPRCSRNRLAVTGWASSWSTPTVTSSAPTTGPRELGLVRDRQLDDRAWPAAQRTLAPGEDVEVDLSPRQAPDSRPLGRLSVRGHVRLLTEDDRRFAGRLRRRPVRARADGGRPAATSSPTSATSSRRRSARWRCWPRRCWTRPTTRRPCAGSPARCSTSRTGWPTWSTS